MQELRHSRQRDAIWEWIRDRHDHPTADSVYTAVRVEFPRISLATVYRNLMLLADQGKLKIVDAGDRVARFDPNIAEHVHFHCTKCGKVVDIDAPELIRSVMQRDFSGVGRASACSICLQGICKECEAAGGASSEATQSESKVA